MATPSLQRIERLISALHPLNRSLVCPDTGKALEIVGSQLPDFKIHEIPSGTPCWTWTAPQEWLVHDAYVKDSKGNTIVSLSDSHLMVASYSESVDRVMTKKELASFVSTDPKLPEAFPFVFHFYYRKGWGVSIPHSKWIEMPDEEYRVVINAETRPGALKVGEFRLRGESDEMITFVTNICHPDQVNDSITGVAAAVEVAHLLQQQKNRYTYQFLFLPETIGSIAYLSQNEDLIPRIRYACFAEMIGTPGSLVLQKTRDGDTPIDKAALDVLGRDIPQHAFREGIANDEMVFNGPGVNIPTISLTRCYDPLNPYPEYHTSLDRPEILDFGLIGEAAEKISLIFKALDRDYVPRIAFKGPVFLTRYDMFVSMKENPEMNLLQEKIMLSLEDGKSVIEIAFELKIDFDTLWSYLEKYAANGLTKKDYGALHEKKHSSR